MPEAKPPTAPSASTKIKALRLMCFSSAKRPVATRKGPSFDQLGQDPALPFIQGFVHLTERIERVLTDAINHTILAFEQPLDCAAIQRFTADGLRDVSTRCVKFRARVAHVVEQRVDRLANDFLLTRSRVQ